MGRSGQFPVISRCQGPKQLNTTRWWLWKFTHVLDIGQATGREVLLT